MINSIKNIILSAALALFLATGYAQSTDDIYGNARLLNQEDDGFRGIWYMISAPDSEYKLKYGGGLGTYPANHYPFSVRKNRNQNSILATSTEMFINSLKNWKGSWVYLY